MINMHYLDGFNLPSQNLPDESTFPSLILVSIWSVSTGHRTWVDTSVSF